MNDTPSAESTMSDPPSAPTPGPLPEPLAERLASRYPWLKSILAVLMAALLGGGATEGVRWASAPRDDGAVEALRVPATFQGAAHAFIDLTAETPGKRVRWRAVTPGIVILDNLPDLIAAKKAVAVACSPGRYTVECWSAVDNEPTDIMRTVVIVGDAAPLPPDPAPNPGPGPAPGPAPGPNPPPIPPDPKPPTPPAPPAPVDPLVAKIQAAYDADTGAPPAKKAQLGLLVALFEQMATHTRNPDVATTADLLGDYREAAKILLMPTALLDVRKLVGEEVGALFGDSPVALNDSLRGRGVALWSRLAKVLSEVKT